ncbi:MAG: ABC transporter substrate-binding protein [Candidatus Acidiferrales bacterium]
MRYIKHAAVWTALKKLAMGLGLIALFSAILLLSDLGHRKATSAASALARAQAGTAGRSVKAAIVYFARDVGTDMCVQGLLDGLKASGFEQGRNLDVRIADSQGEMINIPAILQNYDNSDVDLIMTITTPCLSGACSKVKHKPVVFTCVTDPIAAGAGKSMTDHLPFVTGVGSFPPVAHSLDMMQKLIPGLRAVGTMYNPAEANSVKELTVAREIYHSRGVRLEEVAIAGSNEVLQAVQILAGREIQAIWVPGDNTAIEGYEGAVKGARDARLPLITDDCDSLPRGGLACLGVGFQAAGTAAGKLAGKILLGANAQDIPLEEVVVEKMSISRGEASQLGIAIPSQFSQKLSP